MDRSSLLKTLALCAAIFLFFQFVLPKLTGSDGPQFQPLGREGLLAPPERAPETSCEIEGNRYRAIVTSQNATLRHLWVNGSKYSVDGLAGSPPMDLVTTPDVETRRPLRVGWRAPGADSQVAYDLFDWKLEEATGKTCVFTYTDSKVALRKEVRSTERPFELAIDFSVQNQGTEPAKHRASIETDTWRTDKEVSGGFGRQSPFVTQLECGHDGKMIEKSPGDFAPKDFSKPDYKDGWFQVRGDVQFAAVSNFYFTQALVPVTASSPNSKSEAPECELQAEERWNYPVFSSKKDDPHAGSMYRARLTWPVVDLAPGASAAYQTLNFIGPKEREVLASAGGGHHGLSELIRLGTFASIGKVLVGFLIACHKLVGSWGIAIVMLTLTVRTVLFPLTWKTIKSGAKMRRMKPDLDAINKKYAHDPQQKQLATMELWRKHGVNPVGGCLPTLAQMPVWFALYTSLQTAAELYHTPFLWFRDLSAPDTIRIGHWDMPFILPVLLGATTFLQQKIMPQQMDAAQQKMMMYMMPAVFTAMMLFLPAGLGVYMLTNSALGIVQQLLVERYYASQNGDKGGGISVREKSEEGSSKDAPKLAAPVQGR